MMPASVRPTRLPLVPTLLFTVLVELVVHRVLLQFLKPEVLQPESEVFRLFNEGLGPVVFFFASFLALACCTWLLVNVALDEDFLGLPWRVVLGLTACVFLPVATVGVLVSTAGLKAPSRSLLGLHPWLNVTFVALAAVVCVSVVRRRGPLLPRVGVALLLLPLLLFSLFSWRTAHVIGEQAVTRSSYQLLRDAAVIPRQGQLLLSLVGFWSFVLFYPLVGLLEREGAPPRSWLDRARAQLRSWGQALFEVGPLTVALGAGLAFGVFVKLDYETAVKVIEASLAYNLPAPSPRGLIVVASLTLFALTVAALAWRPGPTRTVAVGLVAVVAASFRLAQPLHDLRLTAPLYYLLAAVGLVAVARGIASAWDLAEESALAAASPPVPDRQWRRLLDGLASKLNVRQDDHLEVSVHSREGTEISEVAGRWRRARLAIRFGRRNRRLLSLTIQFGDELEERADWTAALAERARGAPGEDGPERRLEIHDRAQLSDRLLQESVAERLRQVMRGRVDVWHSVGLRYRAVGQWAVDLSEVIPLARLAAADDDEDLPLGRLLALCDLLYDLGELANVHPADPRTRARPSA